MIIERKGNTHLRISKDNLHYRKNELRQILSGEMPASDYRARNIGTLLCHDILDYGMKDRYVQAMRPVITDIYNEVQNKERLDFPKAFWQGEQGKVNIAICIDHAFSTVLGLKMDESSGNIDRRLFKKNQPELIRSVLQEGTQPTWQSLFGFLHLTTPYLLLGGAHSCIKATYPWSFNLETPEGKHLHPWDFIYKSMWIGKKGYELGVSAIRHIFEKHLGLIMDRSTSKIDERLFPEPGTVSPLRQTRLPRSFGFNEWTDFFEDIGLNGALYGVGKLDREGLKLPAVDVETVLGIFLDRGYCVNRNWLRRGIDISREEFKLGRVSVEDFTGFGMRAHDIMVSLFTAGCIDREGMILDHSNEKKVEFAEISKLIERDVKTVFRMLKRNDVGMKIDYDQESRIFQLLREAIDYSFWRSHYFAMNAAYPWAFNLDTAEGHHLHPMDFQTTDLWTGKKGEVLARKTIAHVLESHMGLEMVPSGKDHPEGIIDKRLINKNIKEFLRMNGAEEWRDLYQRQLLFIMQIVEDRPELKGNFARLFKWVYPWAFDLSKPEGQHLHVWDIALEFNWNHDSDVKEALMHEVKREGWTLNELPKKVTKEWLVSVGLAGLADRFSEDKMSLLKFVYPQAFINGAIRETDFINIPTTVKKQPMKKISSYKMFKETRGFIAVNKVKYVLPKKMIGLTARLVGANIMVYEERIFRGRIKYVPVYSFIAETDKRTVFVKERDLIEQN